jgi:preprotein translocase subunit SecD
VTTILIAIVLYLMGTGPIKGFAVTLFLGNVIDLFSAVTVTRLFMNLAASTRLGNRREMYGV